jgi:transposase
VSCYEAGREGFWLHRYLVAQDIGNVVVDPSSIEVPRHRRRKKTDHLDVAKLLQMLARYHLGDTRVWKVVRPPSVAAEEARQLHRELLALRAERTRHRNRIGGLLATQGVKLPVRRDFRERLAEVRLWAGTPLPAGWQDRLRREFARWEFVQQQLHVVVTARKELLATADAPAVVLVRKLLGLKGIGIESAWLLVLEFFAWRELRNRRQTGALAGLTGTPKARGTKSYEQGISKAGNERVRVLMIELAWGWLRHQPDSALSQEFEKRYGGGSKAQRKIGITALARKLLDDLRRYLDFDELPAGAVLKA